ncbi:hypothetical protein NLI96_g4663 [Meripilus lineatus]|uniref:RRM domain-containing protein n=1 Tax=Meripilus lineatus TaxID=2056292 RepID=A0AAD5V449_9APHY|nr:hypothetical protein NLI96_g4663 [Physisporinus lineatus]
MSTNSVNVSNVAPTTTEKHLHDFFTFCGTITSIDFHADSHSAVIHFEKPQAAKTALMLNGGTLDGSHLSVTSDTVHQDTPEEDSAAHSSPDGVDQTDKPRAGIAAEYLAKGYTLSDQILQRAIELDNKQGISRRFLSYFQSLDTSLGARALGPGKTISGGLQGTIAHAKEVDEQKGYSKQATDYYSRALSSPLGQRVKEFYTSTSKQIHDIHDEARRIADTHKETPPQSSSQETPGSSTEGEVSKEKTE